MAVILALAAASLWTKKLWPPLTRDEQNVVVKPHIDVFVHAEMVGQIRADQSLLRLGDPDMAGRSTPLYHYASYILPASVEVWNDTTTAIDPLNNIPVPAGTLIARSSFGIIRLRRT